jgi:membrane associated rhomboid family serine protease
MSDNLEALLQLIGRAAPQSWYPRAYIEAQGLPPDALNEYLEHLYLDGLVEKGQVSEQTGPGVVLTDKGRQLLEDPEGLQRLRDGKAIDPGDRGGIIRELLRRSFRPVLTWILLLANFAGFGYGIYLANQRGVTSLFLGVMPVGGKNLQGQEGLNFHRVLTDNGAFSGVYLIQGQWWRLLSNGFVHIGLTHLLMNMYMLFLLGRQMEQMYGRWRYLLIYLVALLGASCLVATYGVGTERRFEDNKGVKQIEFQWTTTAGASGAICGLIGAEGVWMFLNRRYLPRSLVRRFRGGFLLTVVMLVFISMFPGVSWQGHLGGLIAGAVAGWLLNFQRFGPSPLRWLGLFVLLPLPWAAYTVIQHVRATNLIWAKLEAKEYRLLDLNRRTRLVMNEAISWYLSPSGFKPMLRRDEANWKGRDRDEVKKLLDAEAGPLEQLKKLEADLGMARQHFRSPEIVVELDALLEYTHERIKLLDMARELLSDRENQLTPEVRKALKEQEDTVTKLRAKFE